MTIRLSTERDLCIAMVKFSNSRHLTPSTNTRTTAEDFELCVYCKSETTFHYMKIPGEALASLSADL